MAWDKKSREAIEPFFKNHGSESQNGASAQDLVFGIPDMEGGAMKKINRLRSLNVIYGLLESVERTSNKFREVLEEPDPDNKIKILSETCDVCYFYGGDHEKCVYEDRCRERFNDNFFNSSEEMDCFAMEEVEFCENIKMQLFQKMDDLCVEERVIFDAYEMGLSPESASAYTGIDIGRIKPMWESLKYNEREVGFVSRESLEKISEAYDEEMSLEDAAKHAGLHKETVKEYWKKWRSD